MRRSIVQIKFFRSMAIVFSVLSVVVEFDSIPVLSKMAICFMPFLRGHRGFFVDLLLALAGSAIVIVIAERVDYVRLVKSFKYKLDLKLKSIKSVLVEIDSEDSLQEILEVRNAKLKEYKDTFFFSNNEMPYTMSDGWNEKLYIVDVKINQLFYIELQTYANKENEKASRLYNLIEGEKGGSGINKKNMQTEIQSLRKSIEEDKTRHLNEIKREANFIRNKIELMDL